MNEERPVRTGLSDSFASGYGGANAVMPWHPCVQTAYDHQKEKFLKVQDAHVIVFAMLFLYVGARLDSDQGRNAVNVLARDGAKTITWTNQIKSSDPHRALRETHFRLRQLPST